MTSTLTPPPTATPPAAQRAATTAGARVVGVDFRNPIVLAAGTAGFGFEIEDVVDLDAIGGIATKAVSVAPRHGAPPLRVSEFAGGMINAIGLANPGLDEVRATALPWLATHHPALRVLVNVVGNSVEEFTTVIEGIEGSHADAYELNVSCPNVKSGGMEFGADPVALAALVRSARRATRRPIFVKLSPALGPAIVDAAKLAVGEGADGLTLINTMPGLMVDTARRRPRIGFGSGGVSGPALLPIGTLATWRVSRALPGVPIIGLGGVSTTADALQYLMAGASLVGVGTAALRDPRAPERIARGLEAWRRARGLADFAPIIGSLEWPT